MQILDNLIQNTQQIISEDPSLKSFKKTDQQFENQDNHALLPAAFPEQFRKQFEGGACSLQRRNKSVKISIHFHKPQKKSANSIQQLFTKQFEAQNITFQISNAYMSKEMKNIFQNVGHLSEFLFNFIATNKVLIDREKIHLIISEEKQLDIIFAQEIQLKKQRNKAVIEIEKVQDKLFQFKNEELQFINSFSSILFNSVQGLNSQSRQAISQDKNQNQFQIDLDLSQEQFIEKQEENTQQQSQEQLRQRLNREEEKIEEFQKINGELLNFVAKSIINSQNMVTSKPKSYPEERIIPEVKTSLPQSALFPPGYTPPHLANSIAPDGFASDSGLKFQANQTKKEKLRMSKQMLKLGYSVDEIIQRLKEIEMAQKTGKIQHKNAYIAPSQGPVRAFHIPRQNLAPMNFHPQRNTQIQRMGNQKKVRERLIGLLKQKRYKKLQDIQKHMAGEGIETTVEILKGMIDDIRTKNAQRKSQNQ